MHTTSSSTFGGHIVALLCVSALHASLAAWAMAPQPPVAIPPQQVIQISMVAPSIIKQDEVKPQEPVVKKETPNTPPKKTGMVKVEQKPKPVQQAKEEPARREQKKQVTQQTQLTSGLQSSDSHEKHAAITEPVAAAYLQNPPPAYPARARSKRQQGTVMLEVRVSTSGAPRSIAISRSSGHTLLDTAALDAVKRWRFVPARRGSQLVEASVVVPVEFRIN